MTKFAIFKVPHLFKVLHLIQTFLGSFLKGWFFIVVLRYPEFFGFSLNKKRLPYLRTAPNHNLQHERWWYPEDFTVPILRRHFGWGSILVNANQCGGRRRLAVHLSFLLFHCCNNNIVTEFAKKFHCCNNNFVTGINPRFLLFHKIWVKKLLSFDSHQLEISTRWQP